MPSYSSSEVPEDSERLSSNRRLDYSCLSGGTSYTYIVAKVCKAQSASVFNLKRSNPPTRLRSIKTQTTGLSLEICENPSLKCVI